MDKFNIEDTLSKMLDKKVEDIDRLTFPDETLALCKFAFIPFEITENQDNPDLSYRLIGANSETQDLLYGNKGNDCMLTNLTEIWELAAQNKLHANFASSYMKEEEAISIAKLRVIPYQIYIGRLEQAQKYKAKCKAEDRPTVDIMRLVGVRDDGLLMYGTDTKTGGSVSTILDQNSLMYMLSQEKIIDFAELEN